MGKRPMTVRMARWSAEHPWRAIALWVVFVAVCFVGGNMAGTHEATVSRVSISAAEGAGPASSIGLIERLVLSSSRASGIGLIRAARVTQPA